MESWGVELVLERLDRGCSGSGNENIVAGGAGSIGALDGHGSFTATWVSWSKRNIVAGGAGSLGALDGSFTGTWVSWSRQMIVAEGAGPFRALDGSFTGTWVSWSMRMTAGVCVSCVICLGDFAGFESIIVLCG